MENVLQMRKWRNRIVHIIHLCKYRIRIGVLGIHGPLDASILPAMPFIKSHFGHRFINVLEIGARYGSSSLMILKSLNVKKYYIVDPFEIYADYADDGFHKVLEERSGDDLFNDLIRRLAKFKSVYYLRYFSHDQRIFRSIREDSLDLVFIDGNHEYEYVLRDLVNYWPLVKKGGIICGDDFHSRMTLQNDGALEAEQLGSRRMVYEAVEDFASKHNLSYKSFGNHAGLPKIFLFTIGEDAK
jgi:predicted O-methyltransferase YrrM